MCVWGWGCRDRSQPRGSHAAPRSRPSLPSTARVGQQENSRECPNPTALPSEEELNFFMGR